MKDIINMIKLYDILEHLKLIVIAKHFDNMEQNATKVNADITIYLLHPVSINACEQHCANM
jgi:hypothetical protein